MYTLIRGHGMAEEAGSSTRVLVSALMQLPLCKQKGQGRGPQCGVQYIVLITSSIVYTIVTTKHLSQQLVTPHACDFGRAPCPLGTTEMPSGVWAAVKSSTCDLAASFSDLQ
eukprot:14732-Heterococcus_DN1.PRE.2